MRVADLIDAEPDPERGHAMRAQMRRLFPLCRSITGDGVRQTLADVRTRLPLVAHEVPSGTPVFDWVVPREWTVRDAYVATESGERLIDFRESNLHLVGYSTPVDATMTLAELRPHLHTLPDTPDLIPYRTAYYSSTWGFCLADTALQAMPDDASYRVVIDTSLDAGSLTYGECVLPGESSDEVLLSTHVCHPSLANDNLTGIALLTSLGEALQAVDTRYTYRLLFVPGTIGSLTWLSRNHDALPRIRHGLVLTGLGGPGALVYKRSRAETHTIDRAATHVVQHIDGEIRAFSPWGYDERQYNSPGFDLPVGRLTRTPHGEYAEYHTSGDNLDFVRDEAMVAAFDACLEIVDALENDRRCVNLSPYGEPQLGKRGLYPSIGGRTAQEQVMAMLWVLNQSDGERSLLDTAAKAGLRFATIRHAADQLARAGLLDPHDQPPSAIPGDPRRTPRS